jgi:thioredoxin-related protein
MMKTKLVFLLFLILFVVCCKNNETTTFPRERELVHFLKTNGIAHSSRENLMVFMLYGTGACSACDETTREIIRAVPSAKDFSNGNLSVIVVYGDEGARSMFKPAFPESTQEILTSTEHLLRRGLLMSTNALVVIRRGKVRFHKPLILEEREAIIQFFKGL